jgi:hypothetical protein
VLKNGTGLGLGSLKATGRHLAGLHVALELVAKLLAFDDFAHSGAFNSRDMYERVSAAVVRLDEAKALGGVNLFTVPVVMMMISLKAGLIDRATEATRMVIAMFLKGRFAQGAVLIAR